MCHLLICLSEDEKSRNAFEKLIEKGQKNKNEGQAKTCGEMSGQYKRWSILSRRLRWKNGRSGLLYQRQVCTNVN